MGADIVGIKHNCRFQQEFGFVLDVEAHPDLGEKPHAFDMMALRLQKVAAQLLGLVHLAFLNKACNCQQLRRQRRQIFHLCRGEVSGHLTSGLRMQPLQHLPAAQQRIIARNGLLIGRKRALNIAHVAQAMPHFLMRAAIGGIERDQVPGQRERFIESFLQSAGDCQCVKRVAVFRFGIQQFFT